MLTNRNSKYKGNGVFIQPATPHIHSTAKVVYDGLLAKNGATHLYAHVGYGTDWNQAQDYEMRQTAHGFEATIPVQKADTLNIAFKDCANNWDNNAGKDYNFEIFE